jgi:hypothetical protein
MASLPEGLLAAVVDGLGHGELAAAAAGRAVEVIKRAGSDPLETIFADCHRALLGTRGAAISAARIDTRSRLLTWMGVGNVEGLVQRLPAPHDARQWRETLLVRGGVVGYELPPLRQSVVPFEPGTLLLFVTDGVRGGFASELRPGRGAQETADGILAAHAPGTDDALALVVSWRGGDSDRDA